MGIKNLKNILVSKCPNAIVKRKLNSYNGLIIGIDLSIYLYKYLYYNGDHIEGLTRLILRLMKNNIQPVFVFDGKPPKEKEEMLLLRKQKREFLFMKKDIVEHIKNNNTKSKNELEKDIESYIQSKNDKFKLEEDKLELYLSEDFNYDEEIEKIEKKIIIVKSHHIEMAKKLFDYFGVNYIHAPCEAESLLAVLCKKNIIDCCITEDMDILANGCNFFLKDFSSDKNYVDEYCLEGILTNLEMSYEQFVDLCILCGCDYTSKIYGIGHVNAYKLIKAHNNIEGILEHIKDIGKYKVPDDFDYVGARKLFYEPFDFNEIKEHIGDLKVKEPNKDKLLELLNNTKLHKKYIEEIEKHVMSYYLNIQAAINFDSIQNQNETVNKKQEKITSYFKK
jgi:flap endonuclease-1